MKNRKDEIRVLSDDREVKVYSDVLERLRLINSKNTKIVSIINGVNIIYESDNIILTDIICKKCGNSLTYGEVIDDYECCINCRQLNK